MNEEVKVFEQQSWKTQGKVIVHKNARITIDDSELNFREQLLANIILRLNAGMEILRKDLENVKKDLENEKEKVKTLRGELNV
jgi:hypothetical protein